MKPITTMRLRFIAKKTPNAESLECLHNCRGITRNDRIRGHAFRHHRASSNDGIFADGDTFQDDRIHSDPNIIGNFHRSCFKRGTGWTIFVKWRDGLSIDESLRRLERMKIRVGDPDVPRDQTVRSDFNSFVRHDERAVEQAKITNDGRAVHSQRKGTPGVHRNVIAEAEGMRCFRFHEAKHLRRFAIKTFAKIDIGWDWMRPPIAFYSTVCADVGHVLNFPDA